MLAVVTAARAQEQFHLDFFKSLGGNAMTTTFTVPDPKLLTDPKAFFDAVQQEETREIAAQIAAFNVFVALKRPDLIKVSFQYAAEEAEHRLLANYAAGARPANHYGFAPARYQNASDIIAELKRIGIIGGSGQAITYPGPGQVDPTNVIERTPGGVAVDCAVVGMPGLPNLGGGGGQRADFNWQGAASLLGLMGLGGAALAALARQLQARKEE